MTDLELIDKYCETCLEFIHPAIFRDINSRGLYNIINHLPKTEKEAKIVARARLAQSGKFYDDEEIDIVAGQIKRLEFLRDELTNRNMADVHKTIPIINEMQEINNYLIDYFKPVYIP